MRVADGRSCSRGLAEEGSLYRLLASGGLDRLGEGIGGALLIGVMERRDDRAEFCRSVIRSVSGRNQK